MFRTQGAIISPIRLRNRSELASQLDVSVKFGFARIQRLSAKQRWSRWSPWVSRRRAISSAALHKNRTMETRHLAGSTRDVGSADHCESVGAVLRRCGLCGPWRRLDEGFTCAAGQFFQSPAGIANQQRHGGARANNSQRASVHAGEPTRSLCGAAVATARLAVHFA
jgi:hypothetical protein